MNHVNRNRPILLAGAAGQTGQEIVKLAQTRKIPLAPLSRERLDITDPVRIKETIDKLTPSLVINSAAYTAVDKAEKEREKAFAINRDGAHNLALCCREADIPLIHISTDYIFGGSRIKPWSEHDRPDPQCVYAISKWQGEEAVKENLARHIILRVSWVFGFYGHNFVYTILRLADSLPELKIVADQHGCPTCASHIADILLNIVENILTGSDVEWGTLHYCDNPATTWHGFAETICNMAYKKGLLRQIPEITPITSDEYPSPVIRPTNSVLDCTKLETVFRLKRHCWKDGLEKMLDTIIKKEPSNET